MSKPIPVFAFALAAFAATCIKNSSKSSELESDRAGTLRLLIDVVRMMSRDGAKINVKLGAVKSLSPPQFCERAALPTVEYEEIWLEDVVETPFGFCGFIKSAPETALLRRGQQVAFVRDEILGWRLDLDMTKRRRASSQAAARLSEELARLTSLDVS